jgi:hypothetical protein
MLGIESGSTGLLSQEISLGKRLWTFRQTDYMLTTDHDTKECGG